MEVKYNAYILKTWLIETISPLGWSGLVSRALPELLEVNPRFSAYYIGKHTRWGAAEIFILRWYLTKMYGVDIPEKMLDSATSVDIDF